MDSAARDWVAWHARTRPAAPALRSGDDGRLTTWGELEERVVRLAGYLRDSLGVSHGDRVAVLAYGDPRVFELQFACMRLGAIMVPLNWRLSHHELAGLAALCSPTTLLYDAAMARSASGGRDPGAGTGRRLARRGHSHSLHVRHDGAAEGALTTRRGMLTQAINIAYTSGVAASGCHHLNPMPLFHAGGLHALANPILYFGGQVTVLARFVPEQTLRVMNESRVTHFNTIPAMFAAMSDLPEFDELDLSAMRLGVIAGAVAPPALLERWHRKGITIQPQYGATETGPAVTALMPPDGLARAQTGTAGQCVPDAQIRLVDEAGRDVPDGTAGEIWLRGPAITPGYWQADGQDYFTDGWFRTGDLAHRDERGHYYVVGRPKEMYKSSGENVYPAEVELILGQAPGGGGHRGHRRPRPHLGETGVAIVVCADGASTNLAALRRFGQARLAKYKLPQWLVVVTELPTNVTGKVNRAALRDQYAEPSAQ